MGKESVGLCDFEDSPSHVRPLLRVRWVESPSLGQKGLDLGVAFHLGHLRGRAVVVAHGIGGSAMRKEKLDDSLPAVGCSLVERCPPTGLGHVGEAGPPLQLPQEVLLRDVADVGDEVVRLAAIVPGPDERPRCGSDEP